MNDEAIVSCKCGESHVSPRDTAYHTCQEFIPMVCEKCKVSLMLILCEYSIDRDYYCEEHCPDPPEWQSDYDWIVECARCGIERGDYWEWKFTGIGVTDNT